MISTSDFNVPLNPKTWPAGNRSLQLKSAGHPGMEDLSGDSIFYKDEPGQIFHTYSSNLAAAVEEF